MRGVVVVFLTLLFSSAAIGQQALPPPPRSAGKSVCVIPAIGHKFAVKKIGLMVFGNALDEIAVDSWGVDELIVRKIGALLGNRFSVRRVNLPKATLAALESPDGGPFRNRTAEWDEAVTATARAAGKCDFYINVYRTAVAYSNTNQSLFGMGIVSHGTELLGTYWLYANFAVRLYDGNTFSVLKTEIARSDPILVSALTTGVGGMNRRVDKTWWPDPPQAAAQSAILKDGIRALVNEGLEKTLPGML